MPCTNDKDKNNQAPTCTYCKWLMALAVLLVLVLLAFVITWFYKPMMGGRQLRWGGAKGGCGCMAAGFV